jgi:hypothetical protein
LAANRWFSARDGWLEASLVAPPPVSSRISTGEKPMFHFLGTPDEHKRPIVDETDHWIDHREVTKETLAGFDTYMGPVIACR